MNMIGKTIDGYRIDHLLGEGGMGEVYLAEELQLGRKVALKFLSTRYIQEADARKRFLREAQSAAALNHPNIVTVYGFGEIEDSYYIAMEYVAGLTLDRVVRSGELPLQKVLDIAIQIADGLREAHHAGIIHRDIKAKNLILDNKGRIKILDFGTAKFIQAPEITMAGTTFGTLHYLSPEQVADLPVDHRSDIFSYGILLYELLTGNRPFQGEGQAAVLYAIMNSQPRPIMQFRQKVPAGIKKLIAKLLEKEANSRYQTMDEVLLDLRREKTLLPITEPANNIDPDYTKPIQRDETMMCVKIVEPGGIPTIPGGGSLSDTGPQAAIIRAIREHGGELIAELEGALYSRFNQSFNAVQSALEIQNSLNRFGLSKSPLPRTSAQIGLHRGNIALLTKELSEAEYNVTGIISNIASPGAILITESVFKGVVQHPQFDLKELGPRELTEIDETHHLYSVATQVSADAPTITNLAEEVSEELGVKQVDIENLNITKILIFTAFSFLTIVAAVYIGLNYPEPILKGLDEAGKKIAVAKAEVSETTVSLPEGARSFANTIRSLQTPTRLDGWLREQKDADKLAYGNRDQFINESDKYVIIVDAGNNRIEDVLYVNNNTFINIRNQKFIDSLSDTYRGKIGVWVDLYDNQ